MDIFQELLSKHPGIFHPSRTPKSLMVHWQLLKQYYLLDDQSGEFDQPITMIKYVQILGQFLRGDLHEISSRLLILLDSCSDASLSKLSQM